MKVINALSHYKLSVCGVLFDIDTVNNLLVPYSDHLDAPASNEEIENAIQVIQKETSMVLEPLVPTTGFIKKGWVLPKILLGDLPVYITPTGAYIDEKYFGENRDNISVMNKTVLDHYPHLSEYNLDSDHYTLWWWS
jgi:hypothetical protein